jgi:hypothetical protein
MLGLSPTSLDVAGGQISVVVVVVVTEGPAVGVLGGAV